MLCLSLTGGPVLPTEGAGPPQPPSLAMHHLPLIYAGTMVGGADGASHPHPAGKPRLQKCSRFDTKGFVGPTGAPDGRVLGDWPLGQDLERTRAKWRVCFTAVDSKQRALLRADGPGKAQRVPFRLRLLGGRSGAVGQRPWAVGRGPWAVGAPYNLPAPFASDLVIFFQPSSGLAFTGSRPDRGPWEPRTTCLPRSPPT